MGRVQLTTQEWKDWWDGNRAVAELANHTMMMFAIGPVQEFIIAGRRTRDLWTGSYTLSYLTWRGIREIIEAYSPDVLLYPDLHHQALVQRWLYQKDQSIFSRPNVTKLALPSFANKVVALFQSANDAKDAAQLASQGVRTAWREIVERVLNHEIATLQVFDLSDGIFNSIWQRQTDPDTVLEIYWNTLTFDSASFQIQHQHLMNEASSGSDFNSCYGQVFRLTQRALDSRKALREFRQTEEQSEKCSITGIHEVLRHTEDNTREKVKKLWADAAVALRVNQRRYVELRQDGQERLGAVSTVKRFAKKGYYEDVLGQSHFPNFPSTSTIAAQSFITKVLEFLVIPHNSDETRELAEKLAEKLKSFIDSLNLLPSNNERIPKTVDTESLPLSNMLVSQIKNRLWHTSAESLIRYDGRCLFEELYVKDGIEMEFNLQPNSFDETYRQRIIRALQGFLRAAKKCDIEKPSKYYAILQMDGDSMGRWLSGEKVSITQSVHKQMSESLNRFAREVVQPIIETKYPGKLVYCGGEDVLAMLPLDCALSAARDLQSIYSGQSPYQGFRTITQVAGATELASMSAGLCITHHTAPLDIALQTARNAEKEAKNKYGRNAFCVHYLKRSGAISQLGAKWFYEIQASEKYECGTSDPPSPAANNNFLLDTSEIIECLRQQIIGQGEFRLSGKIGYALRSEVDSMDAGALNIEAWKAEIGRLIKRHVEGGKKEDRERYATALAFNIKALTQAMHEKREADMPPAASVIADLLLLARFLATGGRNE